MEIGTYSNKRGDILATLTPWGDHWRLTRWMPDGPTGHTTVKTDEDLSRALRDYGFHPDPGAEAVLESWVGTAKWERGCKAALILKCWNACSFHGQYDLGQRLYQVDIDTAVRLVPEIYHELEMLNNPLSPDKF